MKIKVQIICHSILSLDLLVLSLIFYFIIFIVCIQMAFEFAADFEFLISYFDNLSFLAVYP